MCGFDGGGMTLKGIGALSSGLLSADKARTLLMLCMAEKDGADLAKECFEWVR